ncbi:MAG: hypothetical protein KGJ13_08330 [Patescibacteria group bacterium]|nr:hypothetical protein [Patescibacteria group bacterium]
MTTKTLPRVTEILKSAGLIDARFFTPQAAEFGTNVHLLCKYYDENRLNMTDVERLGAQGHLDAWASFRSWAFDFGHEDFGGIEQTLRSERYGFQGTPDRVWYFRSADYILDIKTGTPQKWHAIQLAGYQILVGKKCHRMGVYLSGDGRYTAKLYDDDGDRDVFLAALAISNWKEGL